MSVHVLVPFISSCVCVFRLLFDLVDEVVVGSMFDYCSMASWDASALFALLIHVNGYVQDAVGCSEVKLREKVTWEGAKNHTVKGTEV